MYIKYFSFLLIIIWINSTGLSQLVQLTNNSANEYHPKWSVTGDTIAYTQNDVSNNSIWIIPSSGGSAEKLETNKNGDLAFCWSPNGKEIVFDGYVNNTSPPFNLYIYSLDSETTTALSNWQGNELMPAWSPDGSWIAFSQDANEIKKISTNDNTVITITSGNNNNWNPSWSPDGSKIAFTSLRSGNQDIWVISASGGTAQQITTHSGNDDRACWSPDGQKLAFASDRSGSDDVWIYDFSDGSLNQITSNAAYDSHPDWSPDGTKIAFASERSGNMDVWIITLAPNKLPPGNKLNPEKYILYHNYPNPFNPETTIKYSIPKATYVKITIYNSLGQVTRELVHEDISAGSHEITWDGKNDEGKQVSSGVYYYEIYVENIFRETKKMLMIQ